ncbi:MAG TPA: GntR family transcriptional regulator [Verrucomicrobiae bacterium]|jgi:GntR family transcriptional regulator|nr:GntR family transcriptional regulator [Verrucomicrobiae bacterium]
MLFQLDLNSATAAYQQLVDQVQRGAASDALKPRDSLPGIRPLARELRLNRNTVAKAYSELEHLGVIKTIPGKGCFVEPVQAGREMVADKIDEALAAARESQMEGEEFLELVKERMTVASRENPVKTVEPILDSESWAPGFD